MVPVSTLGPRKFQLFDPAKVVVFSFRESRMSIITVVFYTAAIIGVFLSLYALHVENESLESTKNNSEFTATCDIGEAISCSKVFTSEYGRLFHQFGLPDYPNAFYGFLYYCIIMILMMFNSRNSYDDLLLILASISMMLSAYLAYVLANILNTICIVCFMSYFCNACIFFSVAFTVLAKNNIKVKTTNIDIKRISKSK